MDISEESLINPIYEEKAISIFTKLLIRVIDIIGALVGIILLIPISIYSLINNIQIRKKRSIIIYSKKNKKKWKDI